MIKRNQMELGFDGSPRVRPTMRRQRRLTRARWWFQQMRTVVNQAIDWSSAPPARPEQVYMQLRPARTTGEPAQN